MGLFDFLKPRAKDEQAQTGPVDKNVQRLGRVTADKHAQNYDRMEAIQQLAALGTAESASALLRRFTFYIEPSITDQEEKEVAFRGVLVAKEAAIQPIRDFCARAESLTWPLKILEEILPDDGYVNELLVLLKRFDTEYTKNVEPKLQLIAALEEKKRPDVLEAVEPFLEDVNEPVRFHAVATVFGQENPSAVAALCQALVNEESVRVKNRIGEGLAVRAWPIPESLLSDCRQTLPPGFRVEGAVVRRSH